MKKQLILLLAAASIICCSSCKKIVDTFFSGESFTLPKLSFTIPIIPVADSTQEFETGSFTTYINIDSVMKAKTGGVFGINALSSVKIQKVDVKALNVDADNDLSAIKSFRITIASNEKTAVSDMITVNIPVTAVSDYTESTDNGTNIVDYLRGTTITNDVFGRVRKTTTKSLKIQMVMTLFAK